MEKLDEDTFLKIALGAGVIGLVLLSLFASLPVQAGSDNIAAKAEGNQASISGKVLRVNARQNVTFITLQAEVTIVAFGNVSLDPGNSIRASGEVSTFEGKKELVADTITRVGTDK